MCIAVADKEVEHDQIEEFQHLDPPRRQVSANQVAALFVGQHIVFVVLASVLCGQSCQRREILLASLRTVRLDVETFDDVGRFAASEEAQPVLGRLDTEHLCGYLHRQIFVRRTVQTVAEIAQLRFEDITTLFALFGQAQPAVPDDHRVFRLHAGERNPLLIVHELLLRRRLAVVVDGRIVQIGRYRPAVEQTSARYGRIGVVTLAQCRGTYRNRIHCRHKGLTVTAPATSVCAVASRMPKWSFSSICSNRDCTARLRPSESILLKNGKR